MGKISEIMDIHDGIALQKIMNSLLILKYGNNEYQKVPDQHRGDWGIEGYLLAGEVFQCYAPSRMYEIAQLYINQRDKVTDDINKFKKNKGPLLALLPSGVKFRRWYFLTSVHLSKDLVAHCAEKSKEVIGECDHVSPDFAVMVHSLDDFFLNEIPQYIHLGLKKMRVKVPDFSAGEISTFIAGSNYFDIVKKKIEDGGAPSGRLDGLSRDYIKDYLVWKSMTKILEDASPEVFELFAQKIASLEIDIGKKYALDNNLNVTDLSVELENLKKIISEQIGSTMDSTTLDYLARGILSDWMIRCPISF